MNRNLRLLLVTSMMSGAVYADSAYMFCDMPNVACIGNVELEGIRTFECGDKDLKTHQLSVVQATTVEATSPSSEGWLSYSKRGVASLKDVAYQLLVSNRFFGLESGSCQSWTSLLNVKSLQDQFRSTIVNHTKALMCKSGKSLVSTENCEDVLSEGWEYEVLKSTLATAAKLQKASGVERIYLPFNLYLTNALTGEPIMHRVTLEAGYNGSELKSVRIIDPQTALSGSYLSNANALCEKAFEGLNKTVATEYVAAGVQMPGTGNCQKMAAYIAVESAKNKGVSDLSIGEANAFCTSVHAANEGSGKVSILQAGVKAVSSLTKKLPPLKGLSSWWSR